MEICNCELGRVGHEWKWCRRRFYVVDTLTVLVRCSCSMGMGPNPKRGVVKFRKFYYAETSFCLNLLIVLSCVKSVRLRENQI